MHTYAHSIPPQQHPLISQERTHTHKHTYPFPPSLSTHPACSQAARLGRAARPAVQACWRLLRPVSPGQGRLGPLQQQQQQQQRLGQHLPGAQAPAAQERPVWQAPQARGPPQAPPPGCGAGCAAPAYARTHPHARKVSRVQHSSTSHSCASAQEEQAWRSGATRHAAEQVHRHGPSGSAHCRRHNPVARRSAKAATALTLGQSCGTGQRVA